jgi:hypothetical protein
MSMTDTPKDPASLQEQNLQTAIKHLKDTYNVIERLIQKTYMKNEMDANSALRNVRSDISRLLTEMGSRQLSVFCARQGKLEEFYAAEERFVQDSATLLEYAGSLTTSQDPVDVFMLEGYLRQFEKDLNSRIAVDKNMLSEFRTKQMDTTVAPASLHTLDPASGKSENATTKTFMGVAYADAPSCNDESRKCQEELEAGTLSGIYNYFNILEHKYSCHRPEISSDGSYIGDKKWDFELTDKRITGTVRDGIFRTPLLFETYWHPVDDVKELMHSVQSRAASVSKDQFLSLCLVNSEWSEQITDWSRGFIHSRLMLFLYSLDKDELAFNETADAAMKLYDWHSSERKVESLEEKLHDLMKENESFDAEDVSKVTGLSVKDAERFLQALVNKKMVINLGFGTSMYAISKIK